MAEIFQKLLPYAAPNDLRLVRVNLRDYPGSSEYTAEELDALTSGNPERQAAFIKAQGGEIAALLQSLARLLDTPPITESRRKVAGGIALLTWSMSNCMNVALLGNAASLPEERTLFLNKYLRKCLFLGKCPCVLNMRGSL